MYRWNEFPGLEEAVKKVNDMYWSGLQGVPGGPFRFNIPKFDDNPSLSNTLEEGEIKEEIETEIKQEPKDDPSVSLDFGQRELLPPQQSATPNQLQPPAHQNAYPYKPDSGGSRPSGSPTPSVAQSPIPHPVHHPIYWHGLPHHHYQPLLPPSYPFMPYYNIGFPFYGPDSPFHRGTYPQFSYGAGHPELHAFPERLVGPTPPGTPLLASLPSRSLPPPGLRTSSSNPHKEPSPDTKPPSASALRIAISEPPDSQKRDKRKFPMSTNTSASVSSRPLKRRRPVASDFMSDDDEPKDNQNQHTPLANGLSDFGTWFQQRVTGSKKKLSHLEHVSAPPASKKDP